MGQDTILVAYEHLHKSITLLQQDVQLSYLDALAETLQNCAYNFQAQQVDGLPQAQTVAVLNETYARLNKMTLDAVAWRKVIQLHFLNAIQQDAIQANHHITPDTIGNLLVYFIKQLIHDDVQLLDITAGAGNLMTLLLDGLGEQVTQATAVEVDDVLVSILAMSSQLQHKRMDIKHQDAVLPLLMAQPNVIASDLPVGYYPKDDVASEFKVHVSKENTYAHHLLIENALHNLQNNGWAFFIVPANLFDTNQAPQLLALLTQSNYYLQAFLTLPKTLFKQDSMQKAIVIIQKNGAHAKKADKVLLGELPSFKNARAMQSFIDDFSKWAIQFKL